MKFHCHIDACAQIKNLKQTVLNKFLPSSRSTVFISAEQSCFVTNDDEEIMCCKDEVRSGAEGRKTANLSVKETNKKGRLPNFKATIYMTPHSPNIYTNINMEKHLVNYLCFSFPFFFFSKRK